MAELDHWHPVLQSGDLRDRPAAVRVAGRELVVFRGASGALGALADRCPHRGMRLSLGAVEGDRLTCPYHGWRWAADGAGESPGNPWYKPCAEHFDVVERLGVIWIKRARVAAAFPRFDVEGWFSVGRFRHRAQAPLEVVLDNFVEVEHTGTTHLVLGYPADRMAEVETTTTTGEDWVRVRNVGPQRPLPGPMYALYGIPRDVLFVDDWTTYFSPVFTVYDQYWIDPRTGTQVREALRIAVFFNPIAAAETELFTFAYTQAAPWGRAGLNALLFPMTRALVNVEVLRDIKLLAALGERGASLAGNTLGRFDKGPLAVRRRIERVYRGVPEAEPAATRLPVLG